MSESWIHPDKMITLSDPHIRTLFLQKMAMGSLEIDDPQISSPWWHRISPPCHLHGAEYKRTCCKMYELGHSKPEGKALHCRTLFCVALSISGSPKPSQTGSIIEGRMIKWLCYGYRASWKNRWCRSGFYGNRLCSEDSVAKDLLAPWSEGNRVGQRERLERDTAVLAG